MALPPIISNSPIFKIFQSDSTRAKSDVAKTSGAQTTEDIVEISQAAQERLNGVQQFSSDNPSQVREAAEETGEMLRRDDSLSLGVDPAFDS